MYHDLLHDVETPHIIADAVAWLNAGAFCCVFADTCVRLDMVYSYQMQTNV
jgi:hypothetical protein